MLDYTQILIRLSNVEHDAKARQLLEDGYEGLLTQLEPAAPMWNKELALRRLVSMLACVELDYIEVSTASDCRFWFRFFVHNQRQ